MDIQDVLKLFGDDLAKTEASMRQAFCADTPLLTQIVDYVISSGGKRFRPLLLLASAAMFNCQSESRFRLAAVIEFIHTATLLHDDVVDKASRRRNRESVNEKWGNAASVLAGDFLFSKSLIIMAENGDLEVVRLAATAISRMSEGEISQLTKRGRVDTSEEDYFGIIYGKTAALTAASCAIGARLGQASPAALQHFALIGEHIGTAFQIVDDALDYTATAESFGKDINKDLQEGKVTLPLVQTLRQATALERQFVAKCIAGGATADGAIKSLLALVEKYGGVEYAMAAARLRIAAVDELLSNYVQSAARDALAAIAQYALTRRS
jgi:octaprenyl-diphosphate synthase